MTLDQVHERLYVFLEPYAFSPFLAGKLLAGRVPLDEEFFFLVEYLPSLEGAPEEIRFGHIKLVKVGDYYDLQGSMAAHGWAVHWDGGPRPLDYPKLRRDRRYRKK
ncbi:MAG: hypothetical protein QXW98_05145 [Candidatus Caldarchaeum sp.]